MPCVQFLEEGWVGEFFYNLEDASLLKHIHDSLFPPQLIKPPFEQSATQWVLSSREEDL